MQTAWVTWVRERIKKLLKKEKQWQRLLAQVQFPQGNGLVVRDAQLKVMHYNGTLSKVFGVPESAGLGKPIESYFRPEVALFLQGLDEEALKGRSQAVGVLPPGSALNNARGSYRVVVNPLYDAEDELEGIVTVLTDQSELHLAELALYGTQQRYRMLYDAVPLPSGVFDVDYSNGGMLTLKLIECNYGLLDLMAARPIPYDSPAAETWPVFRETALLEGIARLMGGGTPLRYEFFSGLFGRTFEMTLTRYGEGRLLVFLRDLTDLRQSEDQVLNLHHQLRGSLAVQHKRTEALLDDANEFLHAFADRLDRCAAALRGLAEQCPDSARTPLAKIGSELQASTEKMLRYASVGLLPSKPKLTNLQEVFQELCGELAALYPEVTLLTESVPSMVVPRDALVTALRSLIDLVLTTDSPKVGRRVELKILHDFADTAFAVDFYGVDLQLYREALAGEPEIQASWEHFNSLRLAAVRRILAFNGGVLLVSITADGALRFLLKSLRPQDPVML